MQRIRENVEHFLQDGHIVEPVKASSSVLGHSEVLDKANEQLQAGFRHVAFRVTTRPKDAVHENLHLVLAHSRQGFKIGGYYRLQKLKKVEPVVREILHVARDHCQRALKGCSQHVRHMFGDLVLQFVDQFRKQS